MSTALISDLHLGAGSRSDVLRRAPIRERLIEATADVDRLVLLGDVVELRDLPLGQTLEAARPFFEEIGKAFAGREVVYVPGNHDHRMLGGWLERVDDDGEPTKLDVVVDNPHPALRSIEGWLGDARLEVRYPGVWVRDDVYATHGHYLDSHVTLPTIERLSVATVDRLGGTPTGSPGEPARLRGGPRARLRPDLQPRPGWPVADRGEEERQAPGDADLGAGRRRLRPRPHHPGEGPRLGGHPGHAARASSAPASAASAATSRRARSAAPESRRCTSS